MIPHHVYYQLAVVGFLWVCLMLHYVWPSHNAVSPQPSPEPLPTRSKRNRTSAPKPFEGLTHQPHCAACEHEANHATPPPPRRPDPMPSATRRPRVIDTSLPFCPHAGCAYQGWPGLGNLRANGHPSGGPWRQFHCMSCGGSVLEMPGTIFHGKRASVALIVRVIACLAEGLGIRATARVFEVDPNTVLHWLVEVAEPLQAFPHDFLCDVPVTQLQLDELYAVIRALKAGEISEDEALERLEPPRPWVWTAIDPVSTLLLGIEVGPRTLEMTQQVVHQVVHVLAPGCLPAWLSDGCKGYLPAIVGHFGLGVHPERRQDKGPVPKPRWMPLPGLLYAQGLKQYRRKRLVGVTPRVVCGTLGAIEQVLAGCGWQINTSFIERFNLDIRQRVAAIGRRVNTLCQGEAGIQQQLVVYHAYHHFVLPHASLRRPWAEPIPTNGTGSARLWQLCTPAMAAGLTDHVWSLKEVLRFRVPPWPHTQMV